jgi:hypothetical protein
MGRTGDLIFEGRNKGRPLVMASLWALVNTITPDATVHGFRSAARSFWADHGVDREIAEMNLAHAVGSQVEQAYWRDLGHRAARPRADVGQAPA